MYVFARVRVHVRARAHVCVWGEGVVRFCTERKKYAEKKCSCVGLERIHSTLRAYKKKD